MQFRVSVDRNIRQRYVLADFSTYFLDKYYIEYRLKFDDVLRIFRPVPCAVECNRLIGKRVIKFITFFRRITARFFYDMSSVLRILDAAFILMSRWSMTIKTKIAISARRPFIEGRRALKLDNADLGTGPGRITHSGDGHVLSKIDKGQICACIFKSSEEKKVRKNGTGSRPRLFDI